MIFWLVFFFWNETFQHDTHLHTQTQDTQTLARNHFYGADNRSKVKRDDAKAKAHTAQSHWYDRDKKNFFGTIVQRNDVEHCHFVLCFCVARYHWQPTAANSICVITPNRLVSMAFCGFVDTLKSFLNINYNDLNQIELLLGHFLLRYINTGL